MIRVPSNVILNIAIKNTLSAVLLGLVAAPTIGALVTNAAPPPAVYKTSDGDVIVHSGVTPSSDLTVDYPNVPVTKQIRANYCGLVVISGSSSQPMTSSVIVDGVTISTAGLPVQSVPSCTNNVLADSRPTNFMSPSGSLVVVGKTPGINSSVQFVGSSTTRNVRVNGCGFATISSSLTLPIGSSISINGTSYNTASLPVDNVPLCRNVNNVSVRYDPSNW